MKNIISIFHTGDYETIGGFITSKIGRIPLQGENVTIDNFNFLIARANNIKIDLVKLTIVPSEDINPPKPFRR